MAHTTALYYPWIEVRNERWLKTSILYWDKIRTIAPANLLRTYENDISRQLEDEGFLQPLYVDADFGPVKDASRDFLTFLETDQAKTLIYANEDGNHSRYIHPDKLAWKIRKFAHINPDKISYELRHLLEFDEIERRGARGWFRMYEPLAAYYMTLLASRLAAEIGASITTEQDAADGLSLVVKTGNILPNPTVRYPDARRWRRLRTEFREFPPLRLAEGALATLALESIQLNPSTPLNDLLEFRKLHSAELGRFRTAIGDLASSIDTSAPIDAVRQQIWDTYKNQMEPSLEELKSALTANKVRFFSNTILKTTFLSAGSTSLLATIGLTVPQALLAGAGVSLVAMGVLYDVDRRKSFTDSPYTYLLNLQRSYGA